MTTGVLVLEVKMVVVPRCLPPLPLAPRTTPSPTQLSRQRPPPSFCQPGPIVSTLLRSDFATRALWKRPTPINLSGILKESKKFNFHYGFQFKCHGQCGQTVASAGSTCINWLDAQLGSLFCICSCITSQLFRNFTPLADLKLHSSKSHVAW